MQLRTPREKNALLEKKGVIKEKKEKLMSEEHLTYNTPETLPTH